MFIDTHLGFELFATSSKIFGRLRMTLEIFGYDRVFENPGTPKITFESEKVGRYTYAMIFLYHIPACATCMQSIE